MANTQTLKVGTRVETHGFVGGHGFPTVAPETMTICRPRKAELPLPGEDWHIVKFADGGKACMHASRFRVVDNRAA